MLIFNNVNNKIKIIDFNIKIIDFKCDYVYNEPIIQEPFRFWSYGGLIGGLKDKIGFCKLKETWNTEVLCRKTIMKRLYP